MSEGDGNDRPTDDDADDTPPAERPDGDESGSDGDVPDDAESEDADPSESGEEATDETPATAESDGTDTDDESGGSEEDETATAGDEDGDDADTSEEATDGEDDVEAGEDGTDTYDMADVDVDTAVSGDATASDDDDETESDGDAPDGDDAGFIDTGLADTDGEDDAEADIPEQDVTISGGAAAPTPEDAEPVAAGAPDDQEMPLTDHIEEMVKRLGIVIVIMALVSAVIFPLGDRLINFLWYSFLPGPPTECVLQATAAAGNFTNGTAGPLNASATDAACPRLYHPLALVLARLKVASLGGFIIALPVFVYQTYLFMRPGLYPNERRYYLASVPTSLILAAIGVAFAYLLVLPIIFQYFLGYSQPVADVAFGLSETFGLILLMLGMFAVIFQIPLFIMLAIMMGVTTRRWLEGRRLYFWFGFAGIAFLFSPDPTGMAPFIVALTMVVLFEGSLLLLRWTGR